jgi:hypothetical protein
LEAAIVLPPPESTTIWPRKSLERDKPEDIMSQQDSPKGPAGPNNAVEMVLVDIVKEAMSKGDCGRKLEKNTLT